MPCQTDKLFVYLFLSCAIAGPLPMAMKVREGSPYSQYELLGVDDLGMPPQGPSDSWHRTPGSKMGTMTGTSSWPPGKLLSVPQVPNAQF